MGDGRSSLVINKC